MSGIQVAARICHPLGEMRRNRDRIGPAPQGPHPRPGNIEDQNQAFSLDSEDAGRLHASYTVRVQLQELRQGSKVKRRQGRGRDYLVVLSADAGKAAKATASR